MKTLLPVLAAMLVVCLAPMPYWYYELVRFAAMVAFGVMAYRYNKAENDNLMITFSALALLFQPFFKIALGRAIWNTVDIAVAILLIMIWMKERKKA
ncbi:MAG: hypothetical protein J6K19_10010 [Prevotella sp.]|nr:hypothetical protein [Prevotella sp.]